MRAIVICCVLLGLSVVLFLGISSLRRMETGVTRVVGSDLSSLEAGAVPGHIEALKSPDPSARKKALLASSRSDLLLSHPALALVGFYMLAAIFGWPFLAVAVLGLLESWLGLRRRLASPGSWNNG